MQMAFELKMLAAAVVIGLVHLLWASAAAQPQRGLKWNVGSRETPVVLTGMAGRLERASANFRETFAFFVAAVLVAYLGGRLGALTAFGTALYVGARAVYIFLYAFGVPVVRSLVWVASMAGLGLVLLALVI
ncbi:MAPEG family protein [Caulobacter hibisci]|uniref:MAPEG family protein n=1 Tax=Caulobacter hibisci TaxID=2035993 RepID=A0ABS0SYI6_9CAUL|nr:MAPEG family protein [Caulobacter hibisci]MBI1684501.1 MAPEG family protein [Caulobacter hibisci]